VPEEAKEAARIIKKGGVVGKIVLNGVTQNSYRVFRGDNTTHGLAMSRSIGDRTLKKVGVISTPVTSILNLGQNYVEHIILASDGIWDVMTNREVLEFVDYYSDKCLTHTTPAEPNRPFVNQNNAAIA
jgi:serine/threonine protein phosphatase PrpC